MKKYLIAAWVLMSNFLQAEDSVITVQAEQLGPGNGGQILMLETDPKHPERLFIGSDVAGLWVSEDNGQSYRYTMGEWRARMCQAVAISPDDSNTLYAAVARGIFHTRDLGDSWKLLYRLDYPGALALSLGEAGNEVLFAGTGFTRSGRDSVKPTGGQKTGQEGDGRFHRYNFRGDQTWESFKIDSWDRGVVYEIRVDPVDINHIWLSSSHGVYVSQNAGESWSVFNEGLPSNNTRALIVNPENFEDKIVLHKTRGPYRWHAEDAAWHCVAGNLPELNEYSGLAHYPVEDALWGMNLVVSSDRVREGHGLYYTDNGGAHWSSRTDRSHIEFGWHPTNHVGTNKQSLAVSALGRLWLGKNGNFFYSDNINNDDYEITQGYADTDGLTWAHRGMVNTVPRWVAPHPSDANTVWTAEADRVLWRSQDGGKSFRQYQDQLSETVELHDAFFVEYDPMDSNILFAGASGGFGHKIDDGGIFRSADGGDTWNMVSPVWAKTEVWDITFSSDYEDDHTIYGAARRSVNGRKVGVLVVSYDRGMTWQDLDISARIPFRIEAHATEQSTLFLAAREGSPLSGLWKVNVEGKQVSYESILPNEHGCWGIAVDLLNPSRVYAAMGVGGVFRSDDAGDTWVEIRAPLEYGGEGYKSLVVDALTSELYVSSDGDYFVEDVLNKAHTPRLFVSSDSGNTWRRIEGFKNNWGWHMALQHSEQGKYLYIATKGLGTWRALVP